MNQADRVQIDDAVEVKQISKTNDTETRRELGVCLHGRRCDRETKTDWLQQILLKGDNVSLIQSVSG
jgi:small nuclear ribonucleoprotein E